MLVLQLALNDWGKFIIAVIYCHVLDNRLVCMHVIHFITQPSGNNAEINGIIIPSSLALMS